MNSASGRSDTLDLQLALRHGKHEWESTAGLGETVARENRHEHLATVGVNEFASGRGLLNTHDRPLVPAQLLIEDDYTTSQTFASFVGLLVYNRTTHHTPHTTHTRGPVVECVSKQYIFECQVLSLLYSEPETGDRDR